MKKILYPMLLLSVITIAGCSSNSSDSSDSSKSETSQSTKKVSSATKTESSNQSNNKISASSNTIDQSTQTPGNTNTNEVPQPAESATSSQTNVINNTDQAIQRIQESNTEVVNANLQLNFLRMIGSDYLFEAISPEIQQQGGSGSAGFYRVSPQGVVSVTDANGTPIES